MKIPTEPLFRISVDPNCDALKTQAVMYLIVPEVFQMRQDNPDKSIRECYHVLAHDLQFKAEDARYLNSMQVAWSNRFKVFAERSKQFNMDNFMICLNNAVRRCYVYDSILDKLFAKKRYRDMIFYLAGVDMDFIETMF